LPIIVKNYRSPASAGESTCFLFKTEKKEATLTAASGKNVPKLSYQRLALKNQGITLLRNKS